MMHDVYMYVDHLRHSLAFFFFHQHIVPVTVYNPKEGFYVYYCVSVVAGIVQIDQY